MMSLVCVVMPYHVHLHIDAVYCYTHVAWSVCLCVYVTGMSSAKMAEPIEMPFGVWAWVGPRNLVLDGGPGPRRRKSKGAILEVSYMGMPMYATPKIGIFNKTMQHFIELLQSLVHFISRVLQLLWLPAI